MHTSILLCFHFVDIQCVALPTGFYACQKCHSNQSILLESIERTYWLIDFPLSKLQGGSTDSANHLQPAVFYV